MNRSIAKYSALLLLFSSMLSAQGSVPLASKDDWEEINFEFDSSVLADGFPSLLRLAELLNKNPDYRVKLIGHTDFVGTHPFNDGLSKQRANAVKTFLEKYGAKPGQVSIDSKGKRSPKVENNTREGRFINRRVEMTVTDGAGKVIGAGGAADTVKALEALAKKQEDCCNQILKRLDKLDEILALVRDLKAQNQKLQGDVDELKRMANRGGPAGSTGAAGATGATGATGAAGATNLAGGPQMTPKDMEDLAGKAAKKAVEEMAGGRRGSGGSGDVGGPGGPKLTILGLNAGPDGTGKVSMSGRGRFFAPFNDKLAFQAQGEYMYFRDRQEGQFDAGLVTRVSRRFQAGGFSSFKTVGIKDMDSNGTLGQAAFTGDYLFKHGRVGVFGTKSFLSGAIINNKLLSRNITEQTYLRVVDQIGGSTALQLGRRAFVEANLGYLHSQAGSDRPGGTIRLVFPVNRLIALTAEGGFNETLLAKTGYNGRAGFGVLFGNYLQPREFLDYAGPVPVDIPRVRYEVLTRRLRTGNDPPVADAGPDQIGARAGTIQLDGSGSFDPDGDPIKFLWTQVAGTNVALTGADTAKPTFTSTEGQTYSFRLTVTDDKGAQGIARVTISTRETPKVKIVRFTANPAFIQPGDQAILNYNVENADTVTITGITEALRPDNGNVTVRPTATATYTLTAKNRVSEDVAVVTVVVDRPLPRIISFRANPATINRGGKTSLVWQTQGADSVEITNVGTFGPNGSTDVMPTANQAYVLIARNRFGETTASTVVNVNVGPRPQIVQFSASPVQIVEGDSSTLTWRVMGANTVTIDQGIGKVDPNGSQKVTPANNTVYTLTATNDFGTSTMQATVEVLPRVKIVSFTVTPTTIRQPGEPVTFKWETMNATHVSIDGGIGPRTPNGTLTNAGPQQTQTYTLTAFGRGGSQTTATVTVTLASPNGQNRPPTVSIPISNQVTTVRNLLLEAVGADADGDVLAYSWRSTDGKAEVLMPSSRITNVRLKDDQNGDFLFEVKVTDPSGGSATATVRVTLVPPATPPLTPGAPPQGPQPRP
ncbi:MAG: OmpA family protein [Bryobacteraceae bacterium]